MSFIRQWQERLPASVGQAVQHAQSEESVDFTYGVLALAVVWPIREPVQTFEPEAIRTVHEISNGATAILKALQTLPGNRLAAGRALAAAAVADAELRQGLRELLAYFDATRILQEQLTGRVAALPPSTIDHIQAALVNIGGVMTIDTLNLSMPALPEIPPPAEPDRPPLQPNFVGREADLAYFANKLATEHLAVIAGMAGVGKTALASALARRTSPAENIFWHAFHEGESIDVLIWELANFLAWNGQDTLWRLLQRAQQTAAHPPPATLFNYVVEMIRGKDYLFCLDDFQHVVADRLLGQLVSQLRDLVLAGKLQVVITSRIVPDFVEEVQFNPLQGLDHTDSKQLLAQHGLILDDGSLGALHESTGGNATLLILAAQVLKGQDAPAQALTSLAQATDVERYLLRQVDARITADEQRVMGAVAVLLNYPGTRDALEAILDGINVWRPLQELVQRHLLIVREGEEGRRYSQHDIVRTFYYNSLSRRQRRDMHCRAAAFYETEEPDPLRAGLHYYRAGEVARAADILTGDIWYFVNHGQARAVTNILSEFAAQQLEPQTWVRVNLVLGKVYTVLGEGDQARRCLQQAWEVHQEAEQPHAALCGAICLAMGELLDQEAPNDALEWLQRGLEVAEGAEETQAELHITLGYVHLQHGNFDAALETLRTGLASLREGPSRLRCQALTNLGAVYMHLGEIQKALELTTQALLYSRQLEDHFRTADLLNNMGVFQFTAGHWDEAIASWEQAMTLAQKLGNEELTAAAEGNLAIAHVYMGDDDIAELYFERALSVACRLDLQFFRLSMLFHTAELALRQGDLSRSEARLEEARALARKRDARSMLAEIDGLLAELRLAQGNSSNAREHAQSALKETEKLQMTQEQGRILRTLALIQAAHGDSEAARVSFARSLACLDGVDPYESARTRAAWAQFLLSRGEDQDAAEHLEAARAAFTGLGARRDLAELEKTASGVWSVAP